MAVRNVEVAKKKFNGVWYWIVQARGGGEIYAEPGDTVRFRPRDKYRRLRFLFEKGHPFVGSSETSTHIAVGPGGKRGYDVTIVKGALGIYCFEAVAERDRGRGKYDDPEAVWQEVGYVDECGIEGTIYAGEGESSIGDYDLEESEACDTQSADVFTGVRPRMRVGGGLIGAAD